MTGTANRTDLVLVTTATAGSDDQRPPRRPYQPLDGYGRLVKQRIDDSLVAWSRVPVGLEAAADLFTPFTERERELLRCLAERRYLTIEQIVRRFYSSRSRGYQLITALFTQRFIARFERTPYWMGRALGQANRPPHIYFLDWNGYYLLEGEQAAETRHGRPRQSVGWKADSIGIPNSLTAHLLGTNELWSLLYASARTTHLRREQETTVALEWKGEQAARVSYGAKRTQVVAPDAEIVLRVGPQPADAGVWRGLHDWEWATLERLEAREPGRPDGTRYRTLLLEFETGAHRDAAVIAKIAGYNALAAQGSVWRERYSGVFPRLLVVMREKDQLKRMADLWRKHYEFKLQPGQRACPLLLSSLEQLQQAERQAGAIFGPNWQHVLDPDVGPGEAGCWLNFGDALGVAGLSTTAG